MYRIRSKTHSLLIAGMFLFDKTVGTNATLCPLAGAEHDDKVQDTDEKEYFKCPDLEVPFDHTFCCDGNCCPTKQVTNKKTATIISYTVMAITTCIIIMVCCCCCFCSKCPLYNRWRSNFIFREGWVG
eukprot:GFUD01088881.1.p1 GENE.GFUD01088881.1~~GFUD01088881.1.p1  ORF type:complete len:128 (-),score=26.21 GFUD01088881.1:137-520(-)